jgi:hypothetical protein
MESMPGRPPSLLNPTGAPLPSDPSAQIAIATALGRRITDSSISKAKLFLYKTHKIIAIGGVEDFSI